MKNLKIDLSRGFTLIELVIVFSVLAILSVISIASFVNYSRSQAINNDTKNIINLISQAKSNAFSQVKPSVCVNSVLNGYSVSFDVSGTKKNYSINVICSGFSSDSILKTYNLSNTIVFDNTPGTGTTVDRIYFNVLNGGIRLSYSTPSNMVNSGKIKIYGFNKSQCRLINISNNGTITTDSC